MSGPLYVPVLPIRAHAVAAVKDLAPRIRDRTSPLWTLPVMTAEDADQLKAAVDKELRRVATVQKHTAAWLDAPYADLTAAPYADLLGLYWSHTAPAPSRALISQQHTRLGPWPAPSMVVAASAYASGSPVPGRTSSPTAPPLCSPGRIPSSGWISSSIFRGYCPGDPTRARKRSAPSTY